jgi:hypothetical protein
MQSYELRKTVERRLSVSKYNFVSARQHCADPSQGGLTFNTPIVYHAMTEFWHPNATESDMEAAWDAIDTGPMAVALHDDYVKRVGLPLTTRFPWDTERGIYYLKGIHDLHCLVCYVSISSEYVTDSETRNSFVRLLRPSTMAKIEFSVCTISITAWTACDRTLCAW